MMSAKHTPRKWGSGRRQVLAPRRGKHGQPHTLKAVPSRLAEVLRKSREGGR